LLGFPPSTALEAWHFSNPPAQNVVDNCRHCKSAEKVKVVDVASSSGNVILSVKIDSIDKPDNVDEDTGDVGGIGAPVEAVGEVVRGRATAGEEGEDIKVSTSDNVVSACDDASDGGEEDGIGGEVGGESVGIGEQIPRTHN